MLSIAPLSQGPGYYLALANINYYEEGGEPLPLWHGTGAKEFRFSGVADKEDLVHLCEGFAPGGEALVQNAGSEKRNPGHDLTFSAPKSVSVAWATADDAMRKAIQIKQQEAVKAALDFMEEKAGFARIGRNGQQLVKAPLLFALFEHGTSRAMDPQLHTHALCINLTMHADGRCTAVDSTHLYHWKMAGGAVYRAELARGMQQLGFAVEQRRVGSSIGFELKHIPKDIIEEFSKRRAEIEERLKLKAGSLDAASPKYAEMVAKETRRTKDAEKPRGELFREWRELGERFGIRPTFLNAIREPHGPLAPAELTRRKEAVFREAMDALSEQHSHWSEADLTKAIAERAAGVIGAKDVDQLIKSKLDGYELTPLGVLTTEGRSQNPNRYIDRTEARYTTPDMLRLEREMLESVERIVRGPMSGSPAARIEDALLMRPTIETEQADAVKWLCSGPNIRLMSGLAGTGKTFTLETCQAIWQEEHRDVIGCSISAAAAKRLQAGTGIESRTLDSLLWNLDHEKISLSANSVVVVDEAGMVGTKHMARLLEHIEQAPGTRLVLVGDAKQLQPILAGGPFKHLAEVLGETKLENIRRQEEKWARDAVKDLERGNIRDALTSFIAADRFRLADDRPQAMAQLIEQWKQDGGITKPETVLNLASLNSEVKELNLLAQAERIRAGVVDPDKKIFANGVYFHEGDRLQFQKNSKELGVSNSDMGTVLTVNPLLKRLTVEHDDGREITVSLKRYSPDNLRLGYASTTHKAQGATIPHVNVLVGGPLTDLHMAYVQASRAQKSTHLFSDKASAGDDLRDLIRGMGQERQKTLAQDVINRARQQAPEPELVQAPELPGPTKEPPQHINPERGLIVIR